MKQKTSALLSLALLSFLSISCEKESEKDDAKGGGTLKPQFQASRISSTALRQASMALSRVLPANVHLTPEAIGRAEGSDLESYSFRLQRATLCGQLSTTGSGASCSGGELSIYKEANESSYDNFLPSNAAVDTSSYTNFLDKTALQALTQGVTYTEGHIRSYDSVAMHWYRPFKAKASMTLANGTKLYTKASTSFADNGKSGLDVTYQTLVNNMTTAPAEEGVFFLPNGGTYFKLQKPFEITQADVDAATNFKVVFAFDPDNIITGTSYTYDPSAPAQDWVEGMVDRTLGYQIKAPFLQIAPVIARETETIMREVYLLRAADSSHDIRVSLYYVNEDADKAVRAVTTTSIVYEMNATGAGANNVTSVSQNADGSYDLKDWSNLKVVGGLKRTTTPGQVEGQVVRESCSGEMTSAGCQGTITSASYTYSLVAIGSIDADLTVGYEPPPPAEPETP